MSEELGIFISHKSDDEPIARQIRDLLASGSNQINGFISSEIKAGDDWFKRIKESILESKILLLLLIKPRVDWDWPLLEAGLAVDLNDDGLRRVVCLHHPKTTPPAPLTNWQTVPADEEHLNKFLQSLYGDADYVGLKTPLHEKLANNATLLSRLSEDISSLFSSDDVLPWFPHNRMVLSLESAERPGTVDEKLLAELRETGKIPVSAMVRKVSEELMRRVFGLGDGEYRWEEICNRSAELKHTGWLKETGAAASAAMKRQIDVNIQSTVRTLRGDAIYRPVLYRTEFVGDSPLEFQFIFTEERRPGEIAGSGRLGQLYRMLSLAHRFRSEVLMRFNSNGVGKSNDLGLETAGVDAPDQGERLMEVIGLIEKEADEMGLLDPETLIEPFDDKAVRQDLLQLLTEWHEEIKLPMAEAAREGDSVALSAILKRLSKSNKCFMAICGARYAELAADATND